MQNILNSDYKCPVCQQDMLYIQSLMWTGLRDQILSIGLRCSEHTEGKIKHSVVFTAKDHNDLEQQLGVKVNTSPMP